MSRVKPMWLTVLAGTIAMLLRIGESGRMNQYGRQAMEHWRLHRPTAYRELTDPEAFFTRAGEEMLTQVDALTTQLAGPDLPGEDYLDKVARLNRARSEAEAITRTESGMFPEPEPTFEEWLQTSPQEDALIDWAWRMQAQQEGLAETTLDFEQAATEWMLPRTYLEEMTTASSPWQFWKRHPQEWQASVQARWQRYLNTESTDR
ncbi:MAG: hypothetical protein KF727_02050 [Microbacteriaceae bacterium]|nr:hypothetical protein [Microbacteriaceae bacterium]